MRKMLIILFICSMWNLHARRQGRDVIQITRMTFAVIDYRASYGGFTFGNRNAYVIINWSDQDPNLAIVTSKFNKKLTKAERKKNNPKMTKTKKKTKSKRR